jgi:dipeptidyl aminopeptidase/acylaminoacyl peptidase
MQRLIGNGMEYSDAVGVHAMAEEGVLWPQAAAWLGHANLEKGRAAFAARNLASARSYYLFGSACYRFGQSALIRDDLAKVQLYTKARDAFASAMRLAELPAKGLMVPFGGGALSGWLLRPPGVDRPPVVMIFGGADGWREEYHSGAEYLIQRGVAALLVDGPGQGESRILDKVFIERQPERGYSAIVEALLELPSIGRIGIWGNSLGGCFAARTAAFDSRIAACCVNGGSARPVEVLDRFPRFIERICAMLGRDGHDEAREFLADLEIDSSDNRVECPLLVLHGGQDRIFLTENAQSIHDGAPSHAKRMVVWDDGDHCLYNHSHEKHCIVSDWFKEHLT